MIMAIVAVGCVAGSAMAQTTTKSAAAAPASATEDAFLKEGTILYGGSFGYSSVNVDQRSSSQGVSAGLFLLQAEVNYFVIDNLSIGLSGNIDWLRGDLYGTGVGNATLLFGELVARYYFPVCGNRLLPYVGVSAGAGYGMVSGRSDGGGVVYGDDTATDTGVQAGVLIPLNANVALDTCLKYTSFQLPRSWHTDLNATQVLMGFRMKY
jgi:outer membrane protein W